MLNNPTDDLDEEQIIKRVTLRGIDSELYDQFANHAKMRGISMGDIFTHLFQHATKKGRIHPFLFRGRFGIHHHHQRIPKIEFIENHDSLTISKDDLISAGKETIFAFIRIKNLHFTKDVDSKTLLNHVLFIRSKNVTLEGDIPKLIEFGLIRRKRKYIEKNRELKDITIRNISKSEYHEFLALVKRQNKTVGEKINEELALVVPNLEIQGILIHLRVQDRLRTS